MALGHRRNELRALAQARLDDSILLLANRRYSSAYYLSGYAVELGLKACIAKQFVADVIPDKSFVNAVYQHQLRQLVGVAGLSGQLTAKEAADQNFAANWALVAQWTPETRYQSVDSFTAEIMINAIADELSGVLTWIQAHW